MDVLRLYPKRVLLAIGARVGVAVAFYTFALLDTGNFVLIVGATVVALVLHATM